MDQRTSYLSLSYYIRDVGEQTRGEEHFDFVDGMIFVSI
jgi:hypothetical protein